MAKVEWTYETLKTRQATNSGLSNWFAIDQNRINEFGKATSDPDPMHVDPEWCAKSSPFGGTIAFGFLTMSLLTALLRDALGSPAEYPTAPQTYPLNYGFDRLRFISPIPVNSRIRGHFDLIDVTERSPGQLVVKLSVRIEVEGQTKPALVGEWLTVFVNEREKALDHAPPSTASD